jgi:acyl dehydratase
MPLNSALVGKEYSPIGFEVTEDEVKEFLAAIGDDDPTYAEQGIAPPTFPVVVTYQGSGQVVLDPELGLNYMLVVHGEQEFDYVRPIRIGDVLTVHPRIASIEAKGSNEFLTVEADVTDADGAKVLMARSTLISRGTAAPKEA